MNIQCFGSVEKIYIFFKFFLLITQKNIVMLFYEPIIW